MGGSIVRAKWKEEGGGNIAFELAVSAMELMDTYACNCNCCEKVRKYAAKDAEELEDESSDGSYYEHGLLSCQAHHCECPCASRVQASDNTVSWSKVVVEDGLVSSALNHELRQQVAAMEANIDVDWQPGFECTLRNLFHPSLYCFVEGQTLLTSPPPASPDPQFNQDYYLKGQWGWRRQEDGPLEPVNRYRWLPSEFRVRKQDTRAQVRIASYINGLCRHKFGAAYVTIAKIFSKFVPLFERSLGLELDGAVQVITKISTLLTSVKNAQETAEDWHLDGVPAERILATGLYYYDVQNICDSRLRFRLPLADVDDATDYRQDDPQVALNREMGEVSVKGDVPLIMIFYGCSLIFSYSMLNSANFI